MVGAVCWLRVASHMAAEWNKLHRRY